MPSLGSGDSGNACRWEINCKSRFAFMGNYYGFGGGIFDFIELVLLKGKRAAGDVIVMRSW